MLSVLLALALSTTPSPAPVPKTCESPRSSVRTLQDKKAVELQVAQVVTASWEQLAGATPVCSTGDEDRGISVSEFQIFKVKGIVATAKLGPDGSLHLELCDPKEWNAEHESCTAGHTLVAESPDPSCVGTSQFSAGLKVARKEILGIHPASAPIGHPLVTVTGVGLRAKAGGGGSPSCLSLSPVLDVDLE